MNKQIKRDPTASYSKNELYRNILRDNARADYLKQCMYRDLNTVQNSNA